VHQGLSRTLGPDHPDTLTAAVNLGRAYYSVGQITDAGAVLRETVSRAERVLGPGSTVTQSARESLTASVGE
jgi:hypothetical protein